MSEKYNNFGAWNPWMIQDEGEINQQNDFVADELNWPSNKNMICRYLELGLCFASYFEPRTKAKCCELRILRNMVVQKCSTDVAQIIALLNQ